MEDETIGPEAQIVASSFDLRGLPSTWHGLVTRALKTSGEPPQPNNQLTEQPSGESSPPQMSKQHLQPIPIE